MKARVGVYTVGLKHYWSQFAGLEDRMKGYNEFIAKKMRDMGAEVFNAGLVDDERRAREAGEYFNANNVDVIFLHVGTYATSAAVVPVHQICQAQTVILNLQPCTRVNYDKTTTGEWLAHCNACPAPEIANAFNRCGIPYKIISGLLGLSETPAISLTDENTSARPEAIRAWKEIAEWINAAKVVRTLRYTRFGFLGNTYSGMLDLYSDFTMLQAQTGIHIEVLEMCDLKHYLDRVTEEDILAAMKEIHELFEISGDSPADPLAKNRRKSSFCGQRKWLRHRRNLLNTTNSGRSPITIMARTAMSTSSCNRVLLSGILS